MTVQSSRIYSLLTARTILFSENEICLCEDEDVTAVMNMEGKELTPEAFINC